MDDLDVAGVGRVKAVVRVSRGEERTCWIQTCDAIQISAQCLPCVTADVRSERVADTFDLAEAQVEVSLEGSHKNGNVFSDLLY